VFNAALEQSEQLFAAASTVDYASRPILAFYGLSQAGRAIAACATGIRGNGWELVGHGITVSNLDQGPAWHDLTVVSEQAGSFATVTTLLGSAPLGQATPLGTIASWLPELRHALDGIISDTPVLNLEITSTGAEGALGCVSGVPARFADPHTEEDAREFLSRYPQLEGHDHPEGTAFGPRRRNGSDALFRRWPTETGNRQLIEGRRTTAYISDDDRYVFPAPPGSDRPIHPLSAWWAVLFALSMLARYKPAHWAEHLDISRNVTAVALEIILEAAVEVCPRLILRAIHDCGRWPEDGGGTPPPVG
jgi:hypothetical protein